MMVGTKIDDMNSIEEFVDEVLQVLMSFLNEILSRIKRGVQMKIGIDCDGVLRDLITCIVDGIKTTHPQHFDKILEPTSWDWDHGYLFGQMMKLNNMCLKITT